MLVATSSLTSHASLAAMQEKAKSYDVYVYVDVDVVRCRVSGVYFSIPKAKAWRVKVKQEG